MAVRCRSLSRHAGFGLFFLALPLDSYYFGFCVIVDFAKAYPTSGFVCHSEQTLLSGTDGYEFQRLGFFSRPTDSGPCLDCYLVVALPYGMFRNISHRLSVVF